MKKAIIMMSAILIGGVTYAQKVSESEVPAAVKTKFTSLYPNSKVEKWEKEKGSYKAEFDENKSETCVIIDDKGNLVKTKTEISISELPAAATAYIEKNCTEKKITKACKMTDAKGVVTYKAVVGEKHLFFDSNGTFEKEEKKMHSKKESKG
jgi:hypothetical protein